MYHSGKPLAVYYSGAAGETAAGQPAARRRSRIPRMRPETIVNLAMILDRLLGCVTGATLSLEYQKQKKNQRDETAPSGTCPGTCPTGDPSTMYIVLSEGRFLDSDSDKSSIVDQ